MKNRLWNQFLMDATRWNKVIWISLIGAMLCTLDGCKPPHHVRVDSAFYYWRTTYAPSPLELSYISRLKVQVLYIRFFDVDWDNATRQPIPVSPVSVSDGAEMPAQIVPTIFITNRTIEHLSDNSSDTLGARILRQIDEIATHQFRSSSVSELQFDCDWTETTRDRYFRLISTVRHLLGNRQIRLSVTIRLHQIKYRELTGVPPVDRGVLMFYNMGKIDDRKTVNSILDFTAADKYLSRLDTYPMHLDVALPLYSWGVLTRQGQIIDLLNNVTASDFADSKTFISKGTDIRVVRGTYFNYRQLFPDDHIRLEGVAQKDIERAARLLAPHLHDSACTVIYYHLDQHIVQRFTYEDIQTVNALFY